MLMRETGGGQQQGIQKEGVISEMKGGNGEEQWKKKGKRERKTDE